MPITWWLDPIQAPLFGGRPPGATAAVLVRSRHIARHWRTVLGAATKRCIGEPTGAPGCCNTLSDFAAAGSRHSNITPLQGHATAHLALHCRLGLSLPLFVRHCLPLCLSAVQLCCRHGEDARGARGAVPLPTPGPGARRCRPRRCAKPWQKARPKPRPRPSSGPRPNQKPGGLTQGCGLMTALTPSATPPNASGLGLTFLKTFLKHLPRHLPRHLPLHLPQGLQMQTFCGSSAQVCFDVFGFHEILAPLGEARAGTLEATNTESNFFWKFV